jgi:tetratricopeptide (TPR) repeat protein
MTPLRNDQEAYQALDTGRKALNDDDTALALALAKKALRLQPREALFHSLRGDIRFKQQRYHDAIINYNRALQHNNNYFHYYLQRGLANLELNQTTQANSDLKRSLDLLPTAPALNALGQIALGQGDRSSAKNYFSAATGSNSTAGQQAKRALIKLDLPDNPHKYIHVKLLRNRYDTLQLQVVNTTALTIEQTIIAIQFTDQKGKTRRVQQQITQQLAGERSITITTGIGPLKELKNLRAQVTQAQIVK